MEIAMTEKIYLSNARLLICTATVMAVRHVEGDRWSVRTDRTIFHPQGGGQKADRGRIYAAHVLHVAHDGPEVDHFVDLTSGLEVGKTVQMEVDTTWRAFNAAYHTAGHLLAGIVERLHPGARAVSGHQWPGEARVEFESQRPREAFDQTSVNSALAQALEQAWPVRVNAEGSAGRQVQIGDLPPIPCGGTHIEGLNALQMVAVESIKAKGSRIKMSYIAAARG
jgi:alanyl-tRNA synthetase